MGIQCAGHFTPTKTQMYARLPPPQPSTHCASISPIPSLCCLPTLILIPVRLQTFRQILDGLADFIPGTVPRMIMYDLCEKEAAGFRASKWGKDERCMRVVCYFHLKKAWTMKAVEMMSGEGNATNRSELMRDLDKIVHSSVRKSPHHACMLTTHARARAVLAAERALAAVVASVDETNLALRRLAWRQRRTWRRS